MLDERHLQEGRERDPRVEEQRRGSDVDWGDDSSSSANDEDGKGGEGEGEGEGEGGEGMDVDDDVDVKGMERFVRSIGLHGQQQMGMGDLEDEERMRVEDESEGGSGSSEDEQVEEAIVDEDTRLVAEAGDIDIAPDSEDDDEDDSDDDDNDDDNDNDDDDGSFQSRLRKLRARSKGKHRQLSSDLDDFDPNFDIGWDHEGDKEISQVIGDYLPENGEILGSRDRKTRNALFRQVYHGKFDSESTEVEYASAPAPRKKDKGKHLPSDLAEQWERDRSKIDPRKPNGNAHASKNVYFPPRTL
ncbi:hypothetical protein PENSPDRAFT_645650 [Peniophora sp. CONT]|nr:hypothetical protein PENSPDRAFT_645650 [Peniophora sp. CONT]